MMCTSGESDSATDQDIPGPSQGKKRKMYKQNFKKEWAKLPGFQWVESSKKGSTYAWCSICKCDISISAGKVQLSKHLNSEKHRKSFASSSNKMQQKIATMFAEGTKQKNIEDSAKEGIIRTAGFLAEHNLPMNLSEHLIDYIGAVCKDSEIARKMKGKRTKMTRIIKKVTGATQENNLTQLMKKYKFSIIADESTDTSCTKHLCLVTRMCIEGQIEDTFLALIPVVETTGAALYDILIHFFVKHEIPYQVNCIGFASDGASNMIGIRNSLVSRLKDNIPNIFTMKCICHSFHLVASNACLKLPEEVEELTREVYNYFSNSPKRIEELKEFQEFAHVAPAKILRPCQTRWLSLESVVKRLLSQFNALKLYFVDQSANNVPQAGVILRKLNRTENYLYLEFLSFILPMFNNLNKLMQSESPKIHILYKEVTRAIKTILDFYIKDEIVKNTSLSDIDFRNPRNFLKLEDMYFSAVINASNLEKCRLDEVKKRCLAFYIESVSQISSRFPLQDSVFEKLAFIDPETVISRKIRSIGFITKLFPNLINTEIQVIDNEWLALRNFEIEFSTYDICQFWRQIGSIKSLNNDQIRFPHLTEFVFKILTLPISSANVERVFSHINLIKTKQRNKLKTSTISGILHTKSLVGKNNNICANFPISKDLIGKVNQKMYESSDSD